MGVEAGEIAVSHAFHSEIVAPAMGPYRNFLQNIPIKAADMKILSNVTADFFPTDPQGIYDMLIKQMTSPVEFIAQLERMYAEGVRTFIECGPKRVLSAFATSTLKDKGDITVLASNHPKRGGITEFNDLLANMTALGIPVNWSGKAPVNGGKFFNPYYQGWALRTAGHSSGPVTVSGPSALPADKASFAEKFGFNFNPIAVSGIAGGTPGTWDKLFREQNLDEILAGKNMIEPIPGGWRAQQIDKNIIRVVKSPTGVGTIEKIDSVDQSIKLSARAGQFDIQEEFGLPNTVAKAMDSAFRMAIGAGVLALKDAGLPLVHYYKKTTTGSYLPLKWALPEPVASETGVVFASAFPVMEPLLKEVTHYFNHKYSGKTAAQLWEVYHKIVDKLPTEADKAGLRAWLQKEFAGYQPGEGKDPYSFSQNFLLKVIPIADSQFAQWVGAKGPAIHISAACASTTQAVHLAESWIRAGKCKRVVVIAADDITNETLQQWTMPGFLASGTATTKENVSEAALPFDRRRHGLIVGSAAVGMVIEDETLTRNRGMKPLARLLLTDCANSAFHVTRLDTDHVASVMENFIKKVENIYGLKKEEMAPYTMFMSHETYTPARGGSASAEVKALRQAFGAAADKVVVSNVKGFTGHTMGASLEDVIAVRALNTGIIPPIANYREPDPELAGINLSKGGHYDLKYALRFAAGFGSHMAMSLTERVWKAGESRYEDQGRYNAWVREVSGDPAAELEVVFNTLRVKDKKTAGKPPVMPAAPVKEPVGVAAAPAPKPEPVAAAAPQHYAEPKPAPAPRPAPAGLSEETVKEQVLDMVTSKTGYPKDMLELDLDMEADLGIDTVKQAELFAAIREHYDIPRRDNVSLKDYPTIRHCINFVLGEKAAARPAAAGQAPAQQPAPAVKPEQPELLNLNAAPAADKPAEQPAPKQVYPKRHIRHLPVAAPAPVEQEVIKKLAPKRPVAIFAEDLDLAKAFRAELNKHRADSYIFTPAKTKLKDAITVDFRDIAAMEEALKAFAQAHPDTQGIVYLPGCMVKSLSKDTSAFADMTRYALPLFMAAKYLAGGLNKTEAGHTTFMAVVTTLDGGFGYKTKDAYDPVYGAIHGPTLCLRKELEHSTVKLLDFEPSSSNQVIVQKTFYELLYSDKRLAIGYADGKRWTLLGKPAALDKSRLTTQLEGRNVLVTGGGRGLGAMFARMLAEQHKANILIIDLMEIGERAKQLTRMSEAELKAWKMGELWNELKAGPEKPTPALLEKEFTRLKDAADMFKNMEAIRALGVNVTYYRCDLLNPEAFKTAMENIKADFGQIDGVVHFAGLERSKLAVDKAVEEFNLIFNVKAESAINLWKAGIVKDKGFWAMASSIAGKFGNLGQSDYAAANDYVAKFCVSQQNRGVRAISIDMTGYAQIGMGARPGVEAFLKSQEMEFLYPEEGMQAFVDEIAYGKVPEIILSGSLGKLDWDHQLQYEPGFSASGATGFHFVPKVTDLLKGESLAASKEFSLESDPYLLDHSINGTPYVPGVMGLETFAETAAAVTGKPPKALTQVRFAVPIKLLRSKPADVRIKAASSGDGVEMRLESDFVSPKGLRLGQTRTHFKAVSAPDYPSAWTPDMRPDLPKSRKYKTEAPAIYKTYFHGPSFQVLDGILALDKASVLAVFKRPRTPLWKGTHPKLVFHPLVFEALFQACGWRDIQFDRTMALPDAVGAAIAYDHDAADPETLFLYGVFKGRTEDNRSLYDAWAFDGDYNLVAEIRDYAMIPTPI